MIETVSKCIKIPLIVGGGIRTANDVVEKWNAGANIVVVGTAIEKDLNLLNNFAGLKEEI